MKKATKILTSQIYNCDFQMFGNFKNSYIRTHTEKGAKLLGISGWCDTSEKGIFHGQLQGPPHKLLVMRNWLVDSPVLKSSVDFLLFSEMKLLRQRTLNDFKIRPEKELYAQHFYEEEIKDYNNLI